LRDREFRRGPPEVERFGDGHEVAQVTQFHRINTF
jgi:hypothetical protein